jgi:hypothetical protein
MAIQNDEAAKMLDQLIQCRIAIVEGHLDCTSHTKMKGNTELVFRHRTWLKEDKFRDDRESDTIVKKNCLGCYGEHFVGFTWQKLDPTNTDPVVDLVDGTNMTRETRGWSIPDFRFLGLIARDYLNGGRISIDRYFTPRQGSLKIRAGTINGSPCRILEFVNLYDSQIRLFVDSTDSLLVHRVESLKDNDRKIAYSVSNSKFKKVGKLGLWFPFEVEFTETKAGEEVSHQNLIVGSIELGSIDSNIFTLESIAPPVNTEVRWGLPEPPPEFGSLYWDGTQIKAIKITDPNNGIQQNWIPRLALLNVGILSALIGVIYLFRSSMTGRTKQ